MKESEAVAITRELNQLFPRDALEPNAAAAFAKEIALLVNAEHGVQAAHECARSFDRFPSISQFRTVYQSVARRNRPPAVEPPPVSDEVRGEIGRMIAQSLHRMEQPTEENAPAGVEVESLGKGVCADCGHEGNTWTFGESRRPLCSRCARSRLRATAVASATVEP